jgi:hypothetical protein
MEVNLVRGKDLFIKRIAAANLGSLGDIFVNQFSDSVGVMPIDGLYSAKRLSDACIQAANSATELSNEDLFALVINIYDGNDDQNLNINRRLTSNDEIRNRGKSIEGFAESGDANHDMLTKSFHEEISSVRSLGTTESFIVEEEDGEVKTIEAEVIDMLDDAAKEGELSIEGMRSLGLVASNFDTTTDIISDEALEGAQKLRGGQQKNWRLEDGIPIVLCPKCGSDKLCIGFGGMYSCFDCGAEFHFDTNLGDSMI